MKPLRTIAMIILFCVVLGASTLTDAKAGGNGFSLSLSASPQVLQTNQYTSVVATSNADVGPTPYYITVYDQTAHVYVAICGSGMVCSASVIQRYIGTHIYIAYVSDYPTSSNSAGFIVTTSNTVSVFWWWCYCRPRY